MACTVAEPPAATLAGIGLFTPSFGQPRHGARLAALAVLLALGACTSAPNEKDARAWFERHEAKVDALEAWLRAEVKSIPQLDVESPTRVEDRSQALHDFREGLARQVEHVGAIGADVRYGYGELPPGHSHANLLGSAGRSPGSFNKDYVPASQGIGAGDRQVGWGLFHIRADDAYRRGYEVTWSFRHGEAEILCDVAFLE